VQLRGVPALRYQGEDALSFEAELRWNFVPRWALVGFGGVGQAVEDIDDFGGESYLVSAGGVGVRYMIARAFGLHVGLDVAQGPEDTAVYIQVGSAWH
jgi:hemolysin activation/secretion protein